MFCYLYDADGYCGEVVYKYYIDNEYNMNQEEKIEFMIYIAMALRDDNYKNYPHIKRNLEGILLQVLKEYNLFGYFKNTSLNIDEDKVLADDHDQEIQSLFFPIIMNNYVLYSNISNNDVIERELFYMLDMFKGFDQGFRFFKEMRSNFDLNRQFTFQLLWALLQWKEHLENQ
jgi:hypothetical protein